jgi:high-affinity Fe2+/Pb2+ permease
MKRDTVKTLAGLVIIGVIVVATFMYGNAQRQAQLKHDQQVKQQQQDQASSATKSSTPFLR